MPPTAAPLRDWLYKQEIRSQLNQATRPDPRGQAKPPALGLYGPGGLADVLKKRVAEQEQRRDLMQNWGNLTPEQLPEAMGPVMGMLGPTTIGKIPANRIKISNVDVEDIYRNEMFGGKYLKVDDHVKAVAQVSVLPDQVSIQMIGVRPELRRQGLATKLVDDLFREFPDKKIRLSNMTDEGAAFFRKKYKVAEDGTIKPLDR